MRKVFVALAAVFMFMFVSFPAEAATITITNRTGGDIYYLYLSSSGTSSWEEDILGDDILEHRESLRVNVRGSYRQFDLKAEDDDGNTAEWYNFPGNTTQITIFSDGTAEYR